MAPTPHSGTNKRSLASSLLSEVMVLQQDMGAVKYRVEMLERQQQATAPTTTPPAKPSPSQMLPGLVLPPLDQIPEYVSKWTPLLRLMGKVALWIAPRALVAWGVMSGWLGAMWRWVQMVFGAAL